MNEKNCLQHQLDQIADAKQKRKNIFFVPNRQTKRPKTGRFIFAVKSVSLNGNKFCDVVRNQK